MASSPKEKRKKKKKKKTVKLLKKNLNKMEVNKDV